MRKLGIIRRLVGCFYCGYPCPGDVCPYCTDLPARDPLVAKVRLPLSEAERFAALAVRRVISDGAGRDDGGAGTCTGLRRRSRP